MEVRKFCIIEEIFQISVLVNLAKIPLFNPNSKTLLKMYVISANDYFPRPIIKWDGFYHLPRINKSLNKLNKFNQERCCCQSGVN